MVAARHTRWADICCRVGSEDLFFLGISLLGFAPNAVVLLSLESKIGI